MGTFCIAATFTHDLRGLLATRTLENGASSTYTYDAAARLQAMRGTVPVTYSLNAVGQRTGRHDAAFGPESYAYDAIDQVIGANYGGVRSEGFAYDAMGNRQSASDTAAGITAYTVRADNAYTSVGGISTQTDLNGNMVASPLKTENGTLKTGIYAYDGQNRLVTATVNGVTTEFEYDGFNRCLQRRTARAGGGEESLRLVYAGWDLLEERDGAGALTAQYVHGVQTDDIVAKSATSGTVYYHRDGLGSTVALSDATGQIVERYRYDVFGRVEIRSATGESVPVSLFGNRFLFTGREWLSEVGLYDYRNRFYSAELGRFLQTDPIRFAAGDGNLYRYVGNNPINLIDPDGLHPAPIQHYPTLDPGPGGTGPKPGTRMSGMSPCDDPYIPAFMASPGFRLGVGILGWGMSFSSIAGGATATMAGQPYGPPLMAWGFAAHGLAVNNMVQGSRGNGFIPNPTESPQP